MRASLQSLTPAETESIELLAAPFMAVVVFAGMHLLFLAELQE
jgi:hypothetical protein